MASARAESAGSRDSHAPERPFWDTRPSGKRSNPTSAEERPRVRAGQRLQPSWTRSTVTEGQHCRAVVPTRSDRTAIALGSHSEKPAWMRIQEVERPTRRPLQAWDFVTTRKVISDPCREGSQVSFESPSWFHSRYFGRDRVPVGPFRSVPIGRHTMLVPGFEEAEDEAADDRVRESTDGCETPATGGDDHGAGGASLAFPGRIRSGHAARIGGSLPLLPGVGRALVDSLPGARPDPRAGKPFAGRRGLTMSSTYGSGATLQELEAKAAPDYSQDASAEPVRWAGRKYGLPPRARPIERSSAVIPRNAAARSVAHSPFAPESGPQATPGLDPAGERVANPPGSRLASARQHAASLHPASPVAAGSPANEAAAFSARSHQSRASGRRSTSAAPSARSQGSQRSQRSQRSSRPGDTLAFRSTRTRG